MKYFLLSYWWHYDGTDILDSSFGPMKLREKVNAASGSAVAAISGETVTIVSAIKALSDQNPEWIICPMLFQEISKKDYELYMDVQSNMGKPVISERVYCKPHELTVHGERLGKDIEFEKGKKILVIQEDNTIYTYDDELAFVPVFKGVMQPPKEHRGWTQIFCDGAVSVADKHNAVRIGYYKVLEKT